MFPSVSQFQSSERVSLRLAARTSMSSASSRQSASLSPDPSYVHVVPEGQPFEHAQEQNLNGKRELEDAGMGRGRKKKKSGTVPVNAPPHTLNGYAMTPQHMPMHMNMNGGEEPGAGEIPLDPAFFMGAGPPHSGVPFTNYPPQDPSFFREPTHQQQQIPFDPSQQAEPSHLPPQIHYALNNGVPAAGTLVPELQFARCMSNRYRPDPFPRCVSCTRRWAGDTCRFQGIR